jgi:hypothetical protein
MVAIRISLHIYGDTFSPANFFSKINDPLIIFTSNEATDLKWDNKPDLYQFGSTNILNPKKVGMYDQHIGEYQTWYVNFLNKHYQTIKECGGTELNLIFDVFTSGQFNNLEIFDRTMLSQLSVFGVAMPMSIYHLTLE